MVAVYAVVYRTEIGNQQIVNWVFEGVDIHFLLDSEPVDQEICLRLIILFVLLKQNNNFKLV